jgi:hypothetical protein
MNHDQSYPGLRPERFRFDTSVVDGRASRRGASVAGGRVRAKGGHVCAACGRPAGGCRCGKPRQSGAWVRQGSHIVVSC